MRKPATSEKAINALAMLTQAQHYFVAQLSALCQQQQLGQKFSTQEWLRDNGQHGGGLRFEAPQNSLFNQASVNVSQVQYEDRPDKAFISATALSTIIHPIDPMAASIHIHVSWTELRSGKSYWRLMADLNPSIACAVDSKRFTETLQKVAGNYFEQAKKQGDDYFYIPALKAHRGVSHFYLEAFNPQEIDGERFASNFVYAVIDSYIEIFSGKLNTKQVDSTPAESAKNLQLDYHTLYFYQVLTLDKGTTAGLLVHDQNDVGTLGSLPRFINRDLLTQWINKTPVPRHKLVRDLVALLPNNNRCEVTTEIKERIAQAMRSHYQDYPL